jgi:hypothetical protein
MTRRMGFRYHRLRVIDRNVFLHKDLKTLTSRRLFGWENGAEFFQTSALYAVFRGVNDLAKGCNAD